MWTRKALILARGLGWQLLCVSKPSQARPWIEESLELARRGGDRKAEATATDPYRIDPLVEPEPPAITAKSIWRAHTADS